MSLRIIRAGLLDSIQDGGRRGYQHLGINPGGVMDGYAARRANFLVGNEKDDAVIEMHFPSSVFQFGKPALIAITGADLGPVLNGEKIPMDHGILVNEDAVLEFRGKQRGQRSYMALRGGYDLPPWLESHSTNLKAGVGGFKGRPLVKYDEIGYADQPGVAAILKERDKKILSWSTSPGADPSSEIFVTEGREWNRLPDDSKEKFFHAEFMISKNSDRMAYKMDHPLLDVIRTDEIISTAVNFGTIQLLPNGQLLVLMADHQTTGGYPRVAHVISAHLSRLAQKGPGEKIRFVKTDQETAEELLITAEHQLSQLEMACRLRLAELKL